MNRLLRRSALPIKGDARDFFRQAGRQPARPADIAGLRADIIDAAAHHVFHRGRIDLKLHRAARGIAIPRQMNLANRAELTRLHQLQTFLELRHAALLHADLNNTLRSLLRLQRRRPLFQAMRQGLFNVDILPG